MSAGGALLDLNRGFGADGEALLDLNRGFGADGGALPDLNRGFGAAGGASSGKDRDLIEAFDLLSPRVRRLFACGANSLYLCGV